MLIVVEGARGKSEDTYFQLLGRHLKNNKVTTDIKVVAGEGEPSKVLKQCLGHLKREPDFDFACLVVDHDNHPALDRTISDARDYNLRKRKQECPVYVVVTNPQFELWLLWHLQDQTAHISSSDLMKLAIKHRIVKGKNGKCLSTKFPIEKVDEAVSRAKHATAEPNVWKKGVNPYSGIPWLIDLIKTGKVAQ